MRQNLKDPKLSEKILNPKLHFLVILIAVAKVLGLTPVPQEYSSARKYVDSQPRDYGGTVGDFKEHNLKCFHGHTDLNLGIYFKLREGANPTTRAVLATIPRLGQFYVEYFSLTHFSLAFEPFDLDIPATMP